MNADDVRAWLRAACNKAGGQNAFARMHNLSSGRVSEILNEKREPQQAFCKAVGIERVVTYVMPRKNRKAPP